MRILDYIKKNGLKHTFQIIYQYKIDVLILKCMKPFYKNAPLKNIIMIESHNDFDNNGGAFYDYLIENGYNKKYKIVWVLKNKKSLNLPNNVTTVPLLKPSIRKNYYICRAKYFTSDCFTVCKKINKEQIAVHFDHGQIGLKNVTGKILIPDTIDYIATSSECWLPIVAKQYQLSNQLERFKIIGFPYDDILLSPSENEIAKVTNEKYKKVVLWMPTFRKGGGEGRNDSEQIQPLGIPVIECDEQFMELNHFLLENEMMLIIKIHPMQDLSNLKIKSASNIIVLTGLDVKKRKIDNYRLMKDVDACISDYSSAIYDFLLLDRPMAYDFSDLKYYKLGLCVDNVDDYLAGPKIMGFSDMIGFLKSVRNDEDEYAEERKKLKQKLYQYTDRNNCKRAAELLGILNK